MHVHAKEPRVHHTKKSLIGMAVAETPVGANDSRCNCPAVPVHQVGLKIAEGDPIGYWAKGVLVQPTNQIDAHKAPKNPIQHRQHHNRRKEEDPTESHLLGNSCPDAGKGTVNKFLHWRLCHKPYFTQGQKDGGEAKSPSVPGPGTFNGFPKVSLNGPELKETKRFDEAGPEKHQCADKDKCPDCPDWPGSSV